MGAMNLGSVFLMLRTINIKLKQKKKNESVMASKFSIYFRN